MVLSGTSPLSITPAFLYSLPCSYNLSTSFTAGFINSLVAEVATGKVT